MNKKPYLEHIPLSLGQQLLWLDYIKLPNNTLYDYCFAFEIRGNIDTFLLENVLLNIVSKYSALRTSFNELNGVPYQCINEVPKKVLDIIETKLLNEEEIQCILHAKTQHHFDLYSYPLFRFTLIQKSKDLCYFVVNFHHIIWDGYCGEKLFYEISFGYNNFNNYLKESHHSFSIKDWLSYENSIINSSAIKESSIWWKRYLENSCFYVNFPHINDNPNIDSKNCQISFTLSSFLSKKVRSFSKENTISLFRVLFSNFISLIYCYTDQNDLVVSYPLNLRPKELTNIFGFFTAIQPLRIDLNAKMSFIEVLETANKLINNSKHVSPYIFTSKRNKMQYSNIIFGKSNFLLEALSLKDLDITYLSIEKSLSVGDFAFLYDDAVDKIRIRIDYNKDKYDRTFLQKFLKHYKNMLEITITQPKVPIRSIFFLTKIEYNQLLVEWNDTSKEYPKEKTIHELFEEQVAKTPNNVAVVFETQTLTYKQLDERANQLSHYLRSMDVSPNTIVALSVEKSLEMVVGVLGILKAGSAYVPLDPSFPQKRLQFMLEETNASVLLTQSSLRSMFKNYSGILLILDQDNMIQQYPNIKLSNTAYHNHLAYVIYTSGSTGQPKGVMVQHQGVINLITSQSEFFCITQKSRILQFASLNFDAAVSEIFIALTKGATLYVVPREDLMSKEFLLHFINEHKISFLTLPASFLTFISSTELPTLTRLVIAGESPPTQYIKLWQNRLINAYGLTETTVCSSLFTYTSEHSFPIIGRPILNTQIYILDPYLTPVPVGVQGEIYIGGIGLARGYLNQPDLTADKFIPNPFSTNLHTLRLYRTGDLARYLLDGNIELFGRIDQQVKIRGLRIELGEIESVLYSHGNVAQAMVMVSKDEATNKKLFAYIVPRQSSSFKVESEITSSSGVSFSILSGKSIFSLQKELHNHLAAHVPDYMIPTFFIFIDRIPLTPNGKIDRNSLSSLNFSLEKRSDYVAPITHVEKELYQIWSDLLKIKNIGIHDNFFRLGGDSIISIQLVAKARQMGFYFTFNDVFNNPTISSMALLAKSSEAKLFFKPDQEDVVGTVPLTPIQHWFFNNNFINFNHFNQSVLLLFHKKLHLELLNKIFSTLITQHDALRFRYAYNGNQWVQTCLDRKEKCICTKINLSTLQDHEISIQIEKESSFVQQNLNIQNGPIMAVVLFDCGQKRLQRLLIVIHHLVVDGISWRILLEDLERIYFKLNKGELPLLPPKTHSYQQWSNSLIKYAASQALQEYSYWHKIENSICSLPVDFNYGSTMAITSSTIAKSLTKKETTDLLRNVPKAYATQINDILLTALILTIGHWTKEYSLSITLEGHGRENILTNIDLSRSIGWFTALFPVHLNLNKPQDLEGSIKTIKEELRRIPNKGVGYGILSYLTDITLPFSKYPTLSFNYLGQWNNDVTKKKLFSFAQESTGSNMSSKNHLPFLLSINCEIRNETFFIFFTYSLNHYKNQTIEKLAHTFIHKLRDIIVHCCHQINFERTSADFSLLKNKKNLENRIRIIEKNINEK